MNTEAIKAYALAMYSANKDEEDAWYSFDDNWDVNIYDEGWIVRVFVYPVVDGQTLTDGGSIFSFILEVGNDEH